MYIIITVKIRNNYLHSARHPVLMCSCSLVAPGRIIIIAVTTLVILPPIPPFPRPTALHNPHSQKQKANKLAASILSVTSGVMEV